MKYEMIVLVNCKNITAERGESLSRSLRLFVMIYTSCATLRCKKCRIKLGVNGVAKVHAN